MISQKDLAIQAALNNNWNEAVTINESLLNDNPEDIDTLNRYAFALLKLGRFEDAIINYKRVIELDSSNPIALKNLRKLETLSKQKNTNSHDSQNRQSGMNLEDLYIEEAGKTKTVDLINIADKKTLSFIQAGDLVILTPKRSKIFIQTPDKKYLGMLPDSIGMRLNSLMKGGNEYQACIKSTSDKHIIVYIRETKRASKFKNQPSFY